MTPFGPYPLDRASLERDCEVEVFRGSGPGGQNRNKRETGVRLTHRPSGMIATATERRTQGQNLDVAFDRMAERLAEAMHVDPPRVPTRPSRAVHRRRVEGKRLTAQKKALRRRVDD